MPDKTMTCRHCLGCCTSLFEVDKEWLDKHFNLSWIRINVGKVKLRQRVDRELNICPFFVVISILDSILTSCIIYENRPKVCVEYICYWLKGVKGSKLKKFPSSS